VLALVAARLAAAVLVGGAGSGDWQSLLNGPQCRPHHRGVAESPSWARTRRMTVLVDSVLLSGAPALRRARPCWRVHTYGRPALMLRAATADVRARRRVARLVVVGLGYNSLWERHGRRHRHWAARFDHDAVRLLRTLRRKGAREFVWVTLREPTRRTVPPGARGELGRYSWYFPYVNRRLRRLNRRRDDLVLADWARVSRRPGLTYDSIHLNQRGARLMARTIRGAISAEARRQAAPRPGHRGAAAG
jgi:hypothetical protein